MTMPYLPELPVLLVDDEPSLLRSASISLRTAGIKQVLTLEDSRQVLPQLAEIELGVLVLDLTMPHLSGQALLARIVADYPDIPVIIMTATDNVFTAVDCMKMGAFDYLIKPVERDHLVASVTRALEVRVLRNEVLSLKEIFLSDALKYPAAFAGIITQNPAMRAAFRYTELISKSEQPVLITGETGTGKELIAKAVHTLSKPNAEFVAVDVAGLDDDVFTDTLFGHTKGAFTGAERSRQGLIATAAGGTLFLDEIGDLKESSQVKLLRLLQQRNYYPLGSDQPRTSTARIVVATNQDIAQRMKEGRFRKDLFYRLRGHHIHIPPLRERREDLSLLLNHFLENSAKSLGKPVPTVPTALYDLLKSYAFPGNVRELEAMVHDAVTRHQGNVLSLGSFREAMDFEQSEFDMERESKAFELEKLFPDQLPTLKEIEQCLLDEALRRADGNPVIAASIVGLTHQGLNKRLVRSRK